MKRARTQNKRLTLLASLLLLLAIPISLAGVNQVNDLRNRAAELPVQLAFTSDLTSAQFLSAYPSIPYQQVIELTGDLSLTAAIHLGCDPQACGEVCTGLDHTPPTGFILADDGKTLYWQSPEMAGTTTTWPITISATALNQDGTENTVCIAQSYTLALQVAAPNQPPACTLFAPAQTETIPQGEGIAMILEAEDYDSGITSVHVSISSESATVNQLDWTFSDVPRHLYINKDSTPQLVFIPEETGTYTFSAEVTDSEGLSANCRILADHGINIVIPGDNGAPVFSTDPYTGARPSASITTGQAYTYTVEADDPNADPIDYFVINETGWLNFTINSNADGHFTGTFSGTPSAPGSYTVAIALNDGYHRHYATQIWVVNVDSATNDTPQVRVILPAEGSTYSQKDNVTIQWSASDRNLISTFDVYLAKDPTQPSTWTKLTQLGYNYTSYIWKTGTTAVGTYYIAVQATDNQSPAAVGTGISGAFGIGTTPSEETTPPVIVESHPAISHISPPDKSEIEDTQPLISADLTASENASIIEGSARVIIDDEDVSEDADIRGTGERDGSVLYTPAQPLPYGSHSISVKFVDSTDQTATKTWTVTIIEQEPEDEETTDVISVFGFDIPRRIATIFAIGLVLLLLALIIPWLFYAAWRKSKDEDAWDEPESFALPQEPEPPVPPTAPVASISGVAVQPFGWKQEPEEPKKEEPTVVEKIIIERETPRPAEKIEPPEIIAEPAVLPIIETEVVQPAAATPAEPPAEPVLVPPEPIGETTAPPAPVVAVAVEEPAPTPPEDQPPVAPEGSKSAEAEAPKATKTAKAMPVTWADKAKELTPLTAASPEEETPSVPETTPTEDDLVAALKQISDEQRASGELPPEPKPNDKTDTSESTSSDDQKDNQKIDGKPPLTPGNAMLPPESPDNPDLNPTQPWTPQAT